MFSNLLSLLLAVSVPANIGATASSATVIDDVSFDDVIYVEEDADEAIVPFSSSNYPTVEGFEHVYSYDKPKYANCAPYGDFYYDLDAYRTPFTTNSDLILFHVKTQVVPGHVLCRVDDYYYDDYYISFFETRLRVPVVLDVRNNYHTPNMIRLGSWPSSFQQTSVTIQTASSGEMSIENSFEGGVGIDGANLQVEVSGGVAKGFVLSFDSSTAITTTDPQLSNQMVPDIPYNPHLNGYSWNVTYSSYGMVSYVLDSWCLYEMLKETADGFNDFSF